DYSLLTIHPEKVINNGCDMVVELVGGLEPPALLSSMRYPIANMLSLLTKLCSRSMACRFGRPPETGGSNLVLRPASARASRLSVHCRAAWLAITLKSSLEF